MDAQQLAREIEESRSASFWLKKAISAAHTRDVVDALNDAETLLTYCKLRAVEHGLPV